MVSRLFWLRRDSAERSDVSLTRSWVVLLAGRWLLFAAQPEAGPWIYTSEAEHTLYSTSRLPFSSCMASSLSSNCSKNASLFSAYSASLSGVASLITSCGSDSLTSSGFLSASGRMSMKRGIADVKVRGRCESAMKWAAAGRLSWDVVAGRR